MGSRMNHSFRFSMFLSAALFAACPAPTPLPDGGQEAPDAGVTPTARLQVLSPETGAVSFVPETTLELKVLDAAADSIRVTVNALAPVIIDGPIAADETRSTTLTLEPGVNRVHVELLVAGDVVADETPVIFVQESPVPLLEVIAPVGNEVMLRATVEVAGRIISSRPITTATVKVGADAATALMLEPATGGFLFTGTAALAVGSNALRFEVVDDRGEKATATRTVHREADAANPMVSVTWPREGQAVRTRNLVLRGTARDNAEVSTVEVALAGQTHAATLAADGTWSVSLPPSLRIGSNTLTVTAKDPSGNEATLETHVHYGQRLGSGGAHGGALVNGALYTWGRNNLGQTGLDFVSHESRTTWCDRALSANDAVLCKATTLSTINTVCNNPGFVTPTPADSPEALACRQAVANRRVDVCAAAGAGAPANCATSATANLFTACDVAYGVGTPTNASCKQSLVCDPAYAAGSPAHTNCVAILNSVPTTFPAPATPYTPTAVVVPNTTFTSIAFNQNASSALDSNGQLWSWGDNASGQLCLGDTAQRIVPTQVAPFLTAPASLVAISRGYDHLLALDSTGKVWGCGLNSVGQLGDGTSGAANNRSAPTAVVGLPANIVQVAVGAASSYALSADGTVWAWGRNQYGNLGNGMTATSTAANPTPAQVPGLTDVTMLATGRDHVLALKRDGTVWAWGLNGSHQVNASTTDVLSPVMVMGIVDARGVYANGNQGFYEDAEGRLWGWGQNGSGNLGIPDDEDQPSPSAAVFGVSGVLDVGIGALQGFAMRGTQVFAWGWSFHGSLGAGSSAIHTWPYRTPVLVALP